MIGGYLFDGDGYGVPILTEYLSGMHTPQALSIIHDRDVFLSSFINNRNTSCFSLLIKFDPTVGLYFGLGPICGPAPIIRGESRDFPPLLIFHSLGQIYSFYLEYVCIF